MRNGVNLGLCGPPLRAVLRRLPDEPALGDKQADVVIWAEISVMESSAATLTDGSAGQRGSQILNSAALVPVECPKDKAPTKDEFSRITSGTSRL